MIDVPDVATAELSNLAKEVAEYVMGWGRWEWCEVGHSGYGPGWNWTASKDWAPHVTNWNPGGDANDDYRVLERVRKWDEDMQELWGDAMHAIIVRRRDPKANPNSYGLSLASVLDYQPGDWSRAALAAMGDKP